MQSVLASTDFSRRSSHRVAGSVALLALLVTGGIASAADTVATPTVVPAPTEWSAEHLFEQLVQRYRGLVLYKDSVRLAHRTVTVAAAEDANIHGPVERSPVDRDRTASAEHSLGVTVEGSTLAVISSAFGLGGSCDSQDASPLARVELARQLWSLPHLALRFADEPLASLRGGCGTLVPTIVERVRIGDRTLLRLHLESPVERDRARETQPAVAEGHPASAPGASAERVSRGGFSEGSESDGSVGAEPFACGPSTMDLFVNPESLLIERVEHVREIAEGVRYEATLEITPERAVAAPATGPEQQPAAPPAAASTPPSSAASAPSAPAVGRPSITVQ